MTTFDGKTTWHDVVSQLKGNGKGKTFVITGPSEGSMGAVAALALAQTSPAAIYLLGRSVEKVKPVVDKIKETSPSTVAEFVQCDTGDNSSVRAAATKLMSLLASTSNGEIHGLVNNAGISATKQYQVSKDGIESQFAVNHLGHFLLTNLLKDEILKGKGVVLQISSGAFYMTDSNFNDENFNDGRDYEPWMGYARSKAANALFAIALAKRLTPAGVLSLASTPGMCTESKLFENNDLDHDHLMGGYWLGKNKGLDPTPYSHQSTLDEGVANLVLPLLDPAFRAHPGAYIEECQVNRREEPTLTAENAEKLWVQSERILGEKFTW